MIKLLLDNGADIHVRDDWALKWSSRGGYTEIVRLLLESGADINVRNDYALRWASNNGHTELVKLLESYKER